jgi:hypothetical protein
MKAEGFSSAISVDLGLGRLVRGSVFGVSCFFIGMDRRLSAAETRFTFHVLRFTTKLRRPVMIVTKMQ